MPLPARLASADDGKHDLSPADQTESSIRSRCCNAAEPGCQSVSDRTIDPAVFPRVPK
jgi:hypothetical protein